MMVIDMRLSMTEEQKEFFNMGVHWLATELEAAHEAETEEIGG